MRAQWTEAELQKVLAQSEQMLAAITSILIGVDQDGGITIWNAPARRAFGLEREDVMGMRLAECGLSWDWPSVMGAIAECGATQRPARADDVRYVRDGSERFLGITINPVCGHSDVPLGFLLLAADTTERRRTEEALREREATLRRSNSVLQAQQEAGPDGILIVDENRHIVSFNRRFREMWGVPAILTESGDDHRVLSNVLAQMRDPDEFMAKVQHLYEHPTETSRDELHLTDWRVFDRYSGPVAGEDGQHFGRLWYFRDITERKILESQLAQAQKLESIGQLAAGVAHELNTPIQYVGDNARFLQNSFADLTGLLGAYGALADAARSGPVSPALVEEVDAAAESADLEYLLDEIPNAITQSLEGVGRVAAIVRAMKEFSHPGSTHKTAVDLNRAIESTATVARNEWKYVADLVTDFAPDLPPVPCLPGELNQVFLNIIVNAAHAIGDVVGDGAGGKGTITVTTRPVPAEAPSHAEVRIADSGTGIRPEVISKIFDPFFTTKEVGRGTGQGLSIAHGIVVEKHGGTIACESEVGRGTTFIIRLPLAGDGGGADPCSVCGRRGPHPERPPADAAAPAPRVGDGFCRRRRGGPGGAGAGRV